MRADNATDMQRKELEGDRLLNCEKDDMTSVQQRDDAVRDGREKRRCRILLVDDSRDNQRLISTILRMGGAEVTIVGNGREAVDMALGTSTSAAQHDSDPRAPFDVILMDIQMPILDGHEATRQLRTKGYTGPIVACTAQATQEDRQKCLEAGCDDYLTKPVDRRKLLDTVARWEDPRFLSRAQ